MSPTSYQAAPPRVISECHKWLNWGQTTQQKAWSQAWSQKFHSEYFLNETGENPKGLRPPLYPIIPDRKLSFHFAHLTDKLT